MLHRLVMRAAKDRRVRALDGDLLNSTSSNLQVCSRSDIAILSHLKKAQIKWQVTRLGEAVLQRHGHWLH